MRVNEIT